MAKIEVFFGGKYGTLVMNSPPFDESALNGLSRRATWLLFEFENEMDDFLSRSQMMFDNLRKWLSGELVCRRCGKMSHGMCFGFGECICSKCFEGEREFIFLDRSYWLNRLLLRIGRRLDV